MIETLMYAFADVFAPWNLALMTIGVTAGLIAGAIPGFTIAMAVVLTLPFTFGLSPVEGLSTMIGVFVGGLSGGLMSGMLTGIPGTPSSIATTFDGFPMARNGKPGLALGLGVWSSFFGGIFSAVLLVTLAPRLAVIGLEFGPWDYFSLVLFALTITASLSGENLVKGMIAGALGLFIATIGEDEVNGVARFSFGIDDLESGFTFLRWTNLLRSSVIGVFTGVLPAAGGSISNILAYDQAKKASKTPEKFGTGTPDGIIAPESANNATAGGALITMMALGIPGDIITAVMLGALLIHNVQPSPTFISDNPDLAYAIFVAFFLAHFIMIAMQSVTLRLFVMVTRIPMYVLASVILAYCAIGVFALNNISYDIWVLFFFGIIGYVMRQLGFPLAPIILGVVLGHVAELNLSRSLAIDSDLMLFITRPWSLFFLLVSVFSIGFPWYQKARETKAWTLAYIPVLLAAISVPLFMMEGLVRPIIGVALLALSAYLLWRSAASGWKVAPAGDHEVHLEET